MAVHPRASQLHDPELPAVAALLEACKPPSPLRAAVAAAGSDIADSQVSGVTWWPGRSITVTYRVDLVGPELAGAHQMVAVAGSVPDGALIVDDGQSQIGVWIVPHDPALPGMESALDPTRVGKLLDELGAPGPKVELKLRAYRATRRAVVSVTGRRHGLYLKVLQPAKADRLHQTHRHLVDHLPVPQSLGLSDELGLVALQSMGGTTLRNALERPEIDLPAPEAVLSLLGQLPDPPGNHRARSAIDRLPQIASLLSAILPDQAQRVVEVVDRIGTDREPTETPVHGDYYEAQLMVSGDGSKACWMSIPSAGAGRGTTPPPCWATSTCGGTYRASPSESVSSQPR